MVIKKTQAKADAEVKYGLNRIHIEICVIKQPINMSAHDVWFMYVLFWVFSQAYMATSRAQYNEQLLTDQYIKLQMAK